MKREITHNYAGEEVTVEQFCSICDHYPGCLGKKGDRERYVLRDWCGWARVGGIRVSVSRDYVALNCGGLEEEPRKFPREDKQKLIELLKAAEAAG